MRKLVIAALVIAAILILLSKAFNLPLSDLLSDCGRSRWEAAIGFNVVQCTCGNCGSPPLPAPPSPR